jgi:hypothetical protein
MKETVEIREYGVVFDFPDAVAAGKLIGEQVGECAYKFIQAHITGKLIPSSND